MIRRIIRNVCYVVVGAGVHREPDFLLVLGNEHATLDAGVCTNQDTTVLRRFPCSKLPWQGLVLRDARRRLRYSCILSGSGLQRPDQRGCSTSITVWQTLCLR